MKLCERKRHFHFIAEIKGNGNTIWASCTFSPCIFLIPALTVLHAEVLQTSKPKPKFSD